MAASAAEKCPQRYGRHAGGGVTINDAAHFRGCYNVARGIVASSFGVPGGANDFRLVMKCGEA